MPACRSRVLVLFTAAPLLLGAVLRPCSAQQAGAPAPPPDPALLARANRLLSQVPVIDGHNDLPSELLERFGGDRHWRRICRG
jgi:hypothetical protein